MRPDPAAFSLGSNSYDTADALIAAGLWGRWPGLRRITDAGLGLERAHDADELDDEVEEFADELRQDRGLLAADDLMVWLDAGGLTLDDWSGFARRAFLRERFGDPSRVTRRTADALREPLRADLYCSGALRSLAWELAGRAAAAAREAETAGESGAAREGATDPRRAPKPKVPADLAEVLGMSRAECAQRVRRLGVIEEPYRRFVAAAAPPAVVEQVIRSRAADWVRLVVRRCVVADEDQARELAMLVREDGLDLPVAARRARVAMSEERRFAEDLNPDLRGALLGAKAGDLLGPVATSEGFAVVEVLEHAEPGPRDREVVERARASIVRAAVDREIAARVLWADRGLVGSP